MEAEQYAVGLPGGTAASFVGWPEMWEHPEREDQLPNQVFPPSVPETEETRSWEGFIHAYGSFSIHRGVPKERFSELLKVWKAEIQFISNTNEICTHPAYQQIIGMGPLALPFIFGEMQKELGPWFWALKAITGANPVPEEHIGRVPIMTQHWLDWATKQGYVR